MIDHRSQSRFAALAMLAVVWPRCLLAVEPAAAYPEPPQVVFKELFAAVQTVAVFPDGKEFADAVPRMEPELILREFRAKKPQTVAELRAFVEAHFSLPSAVVAPTATTETLPIAVHIDRLWDPLTRSTRNAPAYSSLLTLPHPYVVPGGRFREMYYWDSYFTMLGLVQSGRHDLAEDMVRNFADLIDRYGHVPNGTRSYYLSRSQPPFFFAMVGLLGGNRPAAAYARYLSQLRREYVFWMRDATALRPGKAAGRVVSMADGSQLNRFWDDQDTPRDESYREDTELARTSGREPHQLYRDIRAGAESGWDFGSRWFADGRERATIDTTEIVPVDLNSLMFGLEQAIAAGCQESGNRRCARDFEARAAHRRAAIDRYLWDADAGAYLDYRWTEPARVSRVSAATLYPLFVGLALPSQADTVARTTRRQLLKPGGIVTTPLDTGQQWDSPNGWAPLQWVAIDGLRHYRQDALAAAIACRWMSGVNRLYRDAGKLVEKYDVVNTGRSGGGGEYPTQDGFGWTNGVMRRLVALYPDAAAVDDAGKCPTSGH